MSMRLDDREQRVLDFVKKYMAENGFCPTLREIADHMYYAQSVTAKRVLEKLEAKGYVELPIEGGRRAIRVIGMKFVEE